MRQSKIWTCFVQSVQQVSTDQAAYSTVPATLMLPVTHRPDSASALQAKEAMTVQHVRTIIMEINENVT